MQMQTYIISLPKYRERMQPLLMSLQGTIDNPKIVDGVIAVERFGEAKVNEFIEASKNNEFMTRSITPGEIGCYQAHLDALKRFVDSSDKYCLVLEDDAKYMLAPNDKFLDQLEAIARRLPNMKFLKLDERSKTSSYVKTMFETDLSGEQVRANAVSKMYLCTTAYVWEREAAIEFLGRHDLHYKVAVDTAYIIFSASGGGFNLVRRKPGAIFSRNEEEAETSILDEIDGALGVHRPKTVNYRPAVVELFERGHREAVEKYQPQLSI